MLAEVAVRMRGMARPRFQFSMRWVLFTLIPGVAITAAAVASANFSFWTWVAVGAYNLIAIAVVWKYYRPA